MKNSQSLSSIFSALVIIFTVFSLINANIDFSYDYSVYLYYIDNINNLDFRYAVRSAAAHYPFPYVYIPPAGQFEFGFVIISLFLTTIGFSSPIAYAIIGTMSIAIRAYIIRKCEIGLLFNILITLCFITLFEANAIRVGVSSSLLLISLYQVNNKNFLRAAIFAIPACYIHVQSFIYLLTFCAGPLICLFSLKSKQRRVILSIIAIAIVGYIIPTISISVGTKLDDYLLRTSATTGFNIVSVSSIVVCIYSIYYISKESDAFLASLRSVIWFSSFFSFALSTLFLIIGGLFADIGIRIWQFSFLFFIISTSFLIKSEWENKNTVFHLKRLRILIMICCGFLTINVMIRYPLSNFFHPLFPYTYIEYIRF